MVRFVSKRSTPRARCHLSITFRCCRIPIVRKYIAHRADSVSVPEKQAPLCCCRRLDNLRHQFDLPGL